MRMHMSKIYHHRRYGAEASLIVLTKIETVKHRLLAQSRIGEKLKPKLRLVGNLWNHSILI